MSSTHNRSGSREVTFAELNFIDTPEPLGIRHKPVPHIDVVSGMYQAIKNSGHEIIKESLAVGGKRERGGQILNDVTLTAVFDIRPEGEGFDGREEGTSLALISNNTKEKAINILCGAKVFVCDNLMIHGENIVLQKKHTSNLDLGLELQKGFDLFIDRQVRVDRMIIEMKEAKVKDSEAERFLYRLYANKIIPPRHLREIHDWYFNAEAEEINQYRGTVWGLHNACSRAFKSLPLALKVQRTKAIDIPFHALKNS